MGGATSGGGKNKGKRKKKKKKKKAVGVSSDALPAGIDELVDDMDILNAVLKQQKGCFSKGCKAKQVSLYGAGMISY